MYVVGLHVDYMYSFLPGKGTNGVLHVGLHVSLF